jgi:S-DNA-T family DNA segregation ATPase FtsK/SpoIIIE
VTSWLHRIKTIEVLTNVVTNLTLKVVTGPANGRTASASPGNVVTVGRMQSADLYVMDPAMSRLHFKLRWEKSNWILVDLDSHNGTILGKQKTKSASVKHGDTITAGDTTFAVFLSS